MLMKKEVIEDNENLKKEIKDLKKQLEEEKNAYNRMYNMYVEKDNIINELEKYIRSNEWGIDYEHSNCRTHLLDILEGSDKK